MSQTQMTEEQTQQAVVVASQAEQLRQHHAQQQAGHVAVRDAAGGGAHVEDDSGDEFEAADGNIKCCGCECDRDPKLNTNPDKNLTETDEP
jgi:hypothetical protein